MNTIFVVMEGGLIGAVVAKEAMPDTQVIVIDYDTDGAEAYDLTMIPQGSRQDHPAYCSILEIEKAGIDIDTVMRRIANNEHPEDT